MPTDKALLNDANSLASGMHPPFSPTFCPGCFVVFTDNITFDSDATLELLQTKSHSFWDRLIAFVCADWTPDLHASVASLLLRSFVQCHRCIPRRTRVTREALDDFLDTIMQHACMTLQICLVSRIGGQAKGFFSKRGRWPRSADQLFPYGAERTMNSLVDQMSLHPLVVTVITGLVSVHRPLAFPVLIQEETRGRFISAVVDRLAAAVAAAEADMARIGPTMIPEVKDALAHRHLDSCSHILFMLRAVEVGVDSKDSDRAMGKQVVGPVAELPGLLRIRRKDRHALSPDFLPTHSRLVLGAAKSARGPLHARRLMIQTNRDRCTLCPPSGEHAPATVLYLCPVSQGPAGPNTQKNCCVSPV